MRRIGGSDRLVISGARLISTIAGGVEVAEVIGTGGNDLGIAATARKIAAPGQQRLGDGAAPRQEGEVAERAAARRDQFGIAALLGLGQRRGEVISGVLQMAEHAVGFAAPGQGLRLDVRGPGEAAQPDRLRPVPRRSGNIADPERRLATPEIIDRRHLRLVGLSRGGSAHERCEQNEPGPDTGHFSAITISSFPRKRCNQVGTLSNRRPRESGGPEK